jgi:hypothetical protein
MEPILELATRITTHLWFLRVLCPRGSLDNVKDDDWLYRAAPADYAGLRNILDLVGDTTGTWRSDQWKYKFQMTFPLNRAELNQETVGDAALLERQSPLSSDENWKALRAAGVKALRKLLDRIDRLRTFSFLGEQGVAPTWLRPGITREEMFQLVAGELFRAETWPPAAVSQLCIRVALAKVFIPDGPPSNGVVIKNEFFVEEQIRQRLSDKKCQDTKCQPYYPLWFHSQPRPQPLAEPVPRLMILLEPARFRTLCVDLQLPIPFSMVQRDELDEIGRSRLLRCGDPHKSPMDMTDEEMRKSAGIACPNRIVEDQAFHSDLFGLALSGGGIRSATFALGLLQGMADRNILPYIDVLSTVSGGGYIGSWLISWAKRTGSIVSVQGSMQGSATALNPDGPTTDDKALPDALSITYGIEMGDCFETDGPAKPEPYKLVGRNSDPDADHVRPMQLLRFYSRYLAPQAGLFAADSWTIAATWMRNTSLNLLILTTFLGAALLLPRVVTFALFRLPMAGNTWGEFFFIRGIGGGLLAIACFLIGYYNLATFGPHRERKTSTRGFDDFQVVSRILPFILAGALLEVAALWYAPRGYGGLAALSISLVLLLGLAILRGFSKRWKLELKGWDLFEYRAHGFAAPLGSALAGWVLVYWLNSIIEYFGRDTERGIWMAASAGVCLALGGFVGVVVLLIGFLGTNLPDDQREWWSRIGAWVGIVISVWLVLCGVSFFVPLELAKLGLKASIAGLGWGTITSVGTKLAYSPKSGRDGSADAPWYDKYILNLAPAAFVLGILSLVSFGVFLLVDGAIDFLTQHWPHLDPAPVAAELCCFPSNFSLNHLIEFYWTLLYPGSFVPLILIVILIGLSFLLAWSVDVNQFSMHNFYKNRLVRCYLGASRLRRHRAPNAFTGFDLEDDIRLHRFRTEDLTQPLDMTIDCKPSYAGPFPIVNTTLNVTQGEDLGLQERKGESFIYTPLWSGFDHSRRQASVGKTVLGQYGFRQTKEFGDPTHGGVFLGTAMAISGAAFNSNAGFHTSPTLAFLLTIFGVRLGWWAGNPRRGKWARPSPRIGLLYLIRELTASTTTDSSFVLLSDGGHFENMGLYELIRRRCRYIVLSDAEEDEKFKLEGIGGAIRKCRVDFGVAIDLDLEALKPLGDPAMSRLHYTVGSILYPERVWGTLVYIKSSLTGDEPLDLVEFGKEHPEFPHTSTVDQFFDESHFESYRALGQHVASRIFYHDMKWPVVIPKIPSTEPKIPSTEPKIPGTDPVQTLFDNIEKEWKEKIQSTKKETGDNTKDKK